MSNLRQTPQGRHCICRDCSRCMQLWCSVICKAPWLALHRLLTKILRWILCVRCLCTAAQACCLHMERECGRECSSGVGGLQQEEASRRLRLFVPAAAELCRQRQAAQLGPKHQVSMVRTALRLGRQVCTHSSLQPGYPAAIPRPHFHSPPSACPQPTPAAAFPLLAVIHPSVCLIATLAMVHLPCSCLVCYNLALRCLAYPVCTAGQHAPVLCAEHCSTLQLGGSSPCICR